jgi:hypothetical protein
LRNLLKLPEELPPHPRVFATGDDIARIRSLKNEKWVQTATKRLLLAADTAYEPVGHLDKDADPEKNGTWIHQCMRQALAYHLTDDEKYYERALNDLKVIAEAYLAWPILQGHIRAASYGLAESRFTIKFAGVYDLLAGTALKDADRSLFEEALAHTRDTTNRCQHWTCGNHNTWNLAARLAAGIALGSLGDIEDVLWGWEFEGRSRYGFVHQLRHDLLSDGLHWERTPGYHFYSLMAMVELVCMFQHIGVDLWHTDLPAQMEDDGEDHHRAYGPEGNKSFKAAFDAPFFLSLGDGDLSLVHDSGLENLRGVWIWGPIYELAYQAYGDPKYSWLVLHIEETYQNRPEREIKSLPMSLQSKSGELDFMRLGSWPLPSGHFSIEDDTRISLSGRHEKASTLFPDTGVTVLRNLRGSGAGVHLHWGPHSAGHQSPAALHVDLHAGGKRLTDSPRSGGYEDPTHLTWYRSTIAHNTVTVDGQSMMPYDEQGDSIWRSDSRPRITDGELVFFQPGDAFQACRVINERVYPGVRLDRTVILTEQYFLDVFRVLSREQHQYDYAMHVLGEPDVQGESEPAEFGDDNGYRHFRDVKRWSGWKDDCSVNWGRTGELAGWLRMPDSAILYTAKDPADSDEAHSLGGLNRLSSRSNVIVRMIGKNVVYLSLWQFYGSKVSVKVDECAPENDIVIRTRSCEGENVLTVPFEHREVELGA